MSNFKILNSNLKDVCISKEKNFKIFTSGDYHHGGNTGYLPSSCVDQRGNPISQTPIQKIMERNHNRAINKTGQQDIVIFGGDMIDGKNSKAGGLDISNVNIDIQVEWAMITCSYIISKLKPKWVFGLDGSSYHTDNNGDRMLIKRLSERFPHIQFYFGGPLRFILGEKLWFLNHETSGGVSIIGSDERNWKKMLAKQFGNREIPTVCGYAHLHVVQRPFNITHSPNPVFAFNIPCQKMPDKFCKSYASDTDWDIGFLTFEQEGVELQNGHFERTFKPSEFKQ